MKEFGVFSRVQFFCCCDIPLVEWRWKCEISFQRMHVSTETEEMLVIISSECESGMESSKWCFYKWSWIWDPSSSNTYSNTVSYRLRCVAPCSLITSSNHNSSLFSPFQVFNLLLFSSICCFVGLGPTSSKLLEEICSRFLKITKLRNRLYRYVDRVFTLNFSCLMTTWIWRFLRKKYISCNI